MNRGKKKSSNHHHHSHRKTRKWEDLLTDKDNTHNSLGNDFDLYKTMMPTSGTTDSVKNVVPPTFAPTTRPIPTPAPFPNNNNTQDPSHNSAVNGTLTILILLSVIFCFIWAPTFLRRCDPRYSDRRRREAETLRAAGEAAIRAIENSLAEDNRLPHGMTLEERRDFICNVLVTKKVSGKPISSSIGTQNNIHNSDNNTENNSHNNNNSNNLSGSNHTGDAISKSLEEGMNQRICLPISTTSITTINNKNSTKQRLISEDWKAGTVPDTDTCAICLLEYEEGDEICWSHNKHCHHAFHKDCMLEWLLRHDECPCCRHHYLSLDDQENDDDEEVQAINSPQDSNSPSSRNTPNERSSSINRRRLSNFFVFTTRPPPTSASNNNNINDTTPMALELTNQASITSRDNNVTTPDNSITSPHQSASTSPLSVPVVLSSSSPIIENQHSIVNDESYPLQTPLSVNPTSTTPTISPNTAHTSTTASTIDSPQILSQLTDNENRNNNDNNNHATSTTLLMHPEEPVHEFDSFSEVQNDNSSIATYMKGGREVEELTIESSDNTPNYPSSKADDENQGEKVKDNNHTIPQSSPQNPILQEASFVIDDSNTSNSSTMSNIRRESFGNDYHPSDNNDERNKNTTNQNSDDLMNNSNSNKV